VLKSRKIMGMVGGSHVYTEVKAKVEVVLERERHPGGCRAQVFGRLGFVSGRGARKTLQIASLFQFDGKLPGAVDAHVSFPRLAWRRR
jgi:hypothetical protein